MKETVRALETGALAEVALVAFTVAFVAIVAYAFTLSRARREAAKNLPLEDALPAPGGAPPEASGDGAPKGPGGDGAATDVPTLTL